MKRLEGWVVRVVLLKISRSLSVRHLVIIIIIINDLGDLLVWTERTGETWDTELDEWLVGGPHMLTRAVSPWITWDYQVRGGGGLRACVCMDVCMW